MIAAGAAAEVGAAPAPAGAAATLAMNEEAFRAFYASTARPLWAYLEAVTGDPGAADDLLQESFLRLLGARFTPVDEEHRRRYLFRIATNLLHDRRRRAPRQAPFELREDDAAVDGPAAAVGARHDLGRALARLKPRERQVLWLAHVEEASHAEIAAATGVGTKSVRVLLFRARKRVAALLGGDARARGAAEGVSK